DPVEGAAEGVAEPGGEVDEAAGEVAVEVAEVHDHRRPGLEEVGDLLDAVEGGGGDDVWAGRHRHGHWADGPAAAGVAAAGRHGADAAGRPGVGDVGRRGPGLAATADGDVAGGVPGLAARRGPRVAWVAGRALTGRAPGARVARVAG